LRFALRCLDAFHINRFRRRNTESDQQLPEVMVVGNRSILIGHIEMTPTLLFLLNDFMAYPNGTASTANQLNRSSSPAQHPQPVPRLS
tara:strand:- start:326 stop:589 length:264 start_codon:yes stop_codon:yes gene_type:complete